MTSNIIKDNNFDSTLNKVGKVAWITFKGICQNFLGNNNPKITKKQ